MNPEFQRNLWLELTGRRMVLMAGALGLAFFAAALADGAFHGPAGVTRFIYYVLVVLWGTRNAAMSVVGEIGEHTWDYQRLSAVEPGAMTWGKLFGSTSYNWFGGALCLIVLVPAKIAESGVVAGLVGLLYYLALGVTAQAVALLASLIAVRRGRGHSRVDVFFYQCAGLVAAVAVYVIWGQTDPASMILLAKAPADFIVWWGVALDARVFLLATLAAFTGWAFVGCYRAMRLELNYRNGPFVWLCFLAFIGLYVAGFDAWLPGALGPWSVVARRLMLAGAAYAALCYVTILLELKDLVLYRWLIGRIGAGRIGEAAGALQAWMLAYAAALLCGIGLGVTYAMHALPLEEGLLPAVAGLGFLTRDVAIFVFIHAINARARSDFAVVVVLFAFYMLVPSIAGGLGFSALKPFFYPALGGGALMSVGAAWIEACVALVSCSLALIRDAKPSEPAEPEARIGTA